MALKARDCLENVKLHKSGRFKEVAISKYNMLGMGNWMMKGPMKYVRMPSIDEFITMAHGMGGGDDSLHHFLRVMGIPEESFRSEVESLAGATCFLREARDAEITLFI